MKTVLRNYFKAAFPAIAIQTSDEGRACADVIAAAKEVGRSIVTWSATEGMRDVSAGGRAIDDTQDLMAACSQRRENTVFILRDPHTWPFDRDPILLRTFRDFLAAAPAGGSSVVILANSFQPHPTLEKLVVVLDYEMPSAEELAAIVAGIAESAGLPPAASPELLRALGGLTASEAENALSLSFVEMKGFDPAVIYREKIKAVKRTGLLEIVEPDPRGVEGIGGLEVLKAWILRRRRAWSPEAVEYGLPQPKGVLLVGVPGTGKSLSAKAIGTALGVPTLKLDVGSLFNSLVGESERRTRDALKLAEAISPCVLWIDEIDKGLAGSSGSGSGDSGVTRRMFGTIISWMQEKARPVFIVATANQVSALPPELLRKGRFDEIFAVDLPTFEERKIIFGIHLRNRGRAPGSFDVQALAKVTEGFTGSEIESVVTDAMFESFDASIPLETRHLLTSAQSTIPLATTMKEEISAIREWAKTRARAASAPEAPASTSRKLG
jgi:hypothetical protein